MDTAASLDGALVGLRHGLRACGPIINSTARKTRALVEAERHGPSL